MSIFASHKYKLTSFLVQNTKSFHNYFIRKECGTSINKLYSLDDVYKQIEHTVNSVSDVCTYIAIGPCATHVHALVLFLYVFTPCCVTRL